jgi:hypothetical protein
LQGTPTAAVNQADADTTQPSGTAAALGPAGTPVPALLLLLLLVLLALLLWPLLLLLAALSMWSECLMLQASTTCPARTCAHTLSPHTRTS